MAAKITLITALTILFMYPAVSFSQNVESWRVWSFERQEFDQAGADSVDEWWVNYWSRKLELKQPDTHILLNSDTLTYPDAPQEIWLPLKYDWSVSDSADYVVVYTTFTNPVRWWTEYVNGEVVDASYDLTVEQIKVASPATKKLWKAKSQTAISPAFRVALTKKDKEKAQIKYQRKSDRVNDLIGAAIFAKSVDGKTHNVFGNSINSNGTYVTWPSNPQQHRSLVWRLLKLESKGRIIFNAI